MKKLSIIFLSILSMLAASTAVFATETEVTWTDPEKFRDIDAGQGNDKRYQKKVLDMLQKHFIELASKLPDGQRFKVKITDVDLAGDVKFGTQGRLRIVRDLYYPRLKFTYQVIGKDENLISEGNVELKDMNFLQGNAKFKSIRDEFKYEKAMITDWFNKALLKS